MTSVEIRQSFLDFFKSKQHTLVPSASLMPDSPNLLFTNAGMNQFVPIFLGERQADVSTWAGVVPSLNTRAADTQKCIRAGGKHNDLEDVGLDTYHHTFFEMLGNWSFGDYFKREAIDWAWELVTEVWKFPKDRLYATVYSPDRSQGDPSEFDQEAWDIWAGHFRKAGLDPAIHIVNGGKKDNFWMMGDTGPCGPCSELHVDLTPLGDTRGSLVNKGDARCMEIWNLVFIQFNANPDGTFSPLPAKHVDTGMGFERVTSIIQGTSGFTSFANARISNYETDIFRPIFDEIEKLSGERYGSTLPGDEGKGEERGVGSGERKTEIADSQSPIAKRQAQMADGRSQIGIDVAFRVIADHIRTLGFAIADGIRPGNTDRNYVLRRILRRAVRYGRTLGFREPFFHKLVEVLARTMGEVFPEVRARQQQVKDVLKAEEEAFNKTLDRGLALFEEEVARLGSAPQLSGAFAFRLYDEQGFPLDLTELMARERRLTVDVEGFNRLMEEQRSRARAARKTQVIELSQVETQTPTRFVGYESLETSACVLEVVQIKDKTAVILDASACYAEMGGQVGDTGELRAGGQVWQVANTQKSGHTWLHLLEVRSGKAEGRSAEPEGIRQKAEGGGEEGDSPAVGTKVMLVVDPARRAAIQRHHTVTHLLHWALHEVVSREASQKGSFVGPDKLTFDFNHAALTAQQVADVERLVNERILENAPVSWVEAKYSHIRERKEIMQFFGDKYGDWVRVVQIGGTPTGLDGYSMELCGGTHTRATGEIGLFRIVGENAIAAGVRRIEALAGLEAWRRAGEELALIKSMAGRLSTPIGELEKKLEAMLEHQKALERQIKASHQQQAAQAAVAMLSRAREANGIPAIVERFDADGDTLQSMVNELKGRFAGVILLGGVAAGAVALVAAVSPEYTAKVSAGKLIQQIAPIVGGKGGGKPDNARGGGKETTKLDAALSRARELAGGVA